ncbi:MAG: hypothetical protein F4X39_09390 [Acidobacteriia bacterium]|nr:hypothetical protein [Terriglobia bacterium]
MPGFTTNVAGVTFRQEVIEQCEPGDDIALVREPKNQRDENAIRVESEYGHLGYIPADIAPKMARRLDRGDSFHVFVKNVTGGTEDKPNLGIVLHVREAGRTHETKLVYTEPVDEEPLNAVDVHDPMDGFLIVLVFAVVVLFLIAWAC